MKRAYFSTGYQNRRLLDAEIQSIKETLLCFQTGLFVFVDAWHFLPQQEKQMMEQAFTEIRNSDLLIAEVSEKAIGVGIEIGYAAALQKPLIYLRKTGSEHSTTASGSSGYTIVYEDAMDLARQLAAVMTSLQTTTA